MKIIIWAILGFWWVAKVDGEAWEVRQGHHNMIRDRCAQM